MLDVINYSKSDIKLGPVNVDVSLDTLRKEKILDLALSNQSPRVLDLFAGAGGFSLGFKAAGFKVVGASELDEWASDTIRSNFPDEAVLSGDIRKISADDFRKKFGEVDVIIGGPPCQGFSIANVGGRKADDPRNTLFREYLRAVKALDPELAIIENVAGLMTKKTPEKKLYIDIIQEELNQLGYETSVALLHAQDFGVPQIRPRLIIVGSKKALKSPFPLQTHFAPPESLSLFTNEQTHVPLWAAISDLPQIEAREGAEIMEYNRGAENPLQELLRAGSKQVLNHRAMKHSARLVSRFAQVAWGGSGADVVGEFGAKQRNGDGAGKRFDQNNRRNFPTRPSHTLPASFYANFIHPISHRNYTPREGARLQTFPDWYRFEGKPTVVSQKLLAREGREGEMHLCQYNQIGNAVPPLLAYKIAQNLLTQI